jgi:hypothetical protein
LQVPDELNDQVLIVAGGEQFVVGRTITTPISPTYVAEILRLQEAGATEEDLHPVVAEAITESYFTEWGTRADGLILQL